MSRQVSRGSAGEYQADEQAGVARLSWRVTRKEYETAIDIALGGSIQNIVTEDEETARTMIEMLKKDRAGRATFLPLTAIRNAQSLSRKDKHLWCWGAMARAISKQVS